jgi:hypothetical protein
MPADPETPLRADARRNRDQIIAAARDIFTSAQAEGMLRKDIDTGDVAMMFALLLRQLPSTNDEVARFGPDRCMPLMLDGLRAQPTSAPLTQSRN